MSQTELIWREKAALRGKQGNPKSQSGPQTDSVQTFSVPVNTDYSENRVSRKLDDMSILPTV